MPLPCRFSFPKAVAGMVAVPPMVARWCCGSVMSFAPIVANVLALVVPVLTEGKSQQPQQRGTESQQGNRNAFALSVLFPESGCRCSDGCPWLPFWDYQRERTKSQQRPQRSRKDHCTTTCSIVECPKILLQGIKRQSGCPCGSVMSFAPIAGTSLPWCFLNSQRERASNQQRERNPQQGSRNQPVSGTSLPCRIYFPKASTVAGMVAVALMVVLGASVMSVAPIGANAFVLVLPDGCCSHRAEHPCLGCPYVLGRVRSSDGCPCLVVL